MKFIPFIIAILSVSVPAQAENYSWIKGGIGFGNTEACVSGTCYDNTSQPQLETSRDFFVAVSPGSYRARLFKDLGLRIEPFGEYSERDVRIEFPGNTFNVDGEQKEFALGVNLFFDYRIAPEWTLYVGPKAGLQFSKIDADAGNAPGTVVNTDIDYDFFPGVEAGMEYRVSRQMALGAFWAWANPDKYQDQTFQLKYDHDRGHRVGLSLTVFWNN